MPRGANTLMDKKKRRNTSFRTKLIIMFSIVMITLFVLIFIVFAVSFGNQTTAQMHFSMKQSFQQAKEVIEEHMGSVGYAANLLQNDDLLYTVAVKAADLDREKDAGEEYRDMYRIDTQLSAMQNQHITSISIYLGSGFTYTELGTTFVDIRQLSDAGIKELFSQKRSTQFWRIEEWKGRMEIGRYVSINAPSSYYDEVTCVVRVGMDAEEILDILSRANITQEGFSLLYSRDKSDYLTNSELPFRWETFEDSFPSSIAGEGADVWIDGCQYYAFADSIANTEWNLLIAMPSNAITQNTLELMKLTMSVLALVFVAGLYLCALISKSMTKRISDIVDKLDRAQSGELTVRVDVTENDEIGQLGDAFNYFLERIAVLNREQFYSGQAIKQAELRALRAQINPHLLYNTLDMIHWEALDYQADSIVQMTELLARFYKLTLNSGRDFVPLADEIAHVKAYVQIQNIRFENSVVFTTEIPDELQRVKMPHLLLQPLVENAFLHGIANKVGRRGRIDITASAKEGDVFLRITDDGVGMTEESVRMLNSDEANASGYGYSNVRERLVRLYGSQYAPVVESSEKGTQILVRVPLEILLD